MTRRFACQPPTHPGLELRPLSYQADTIPTIPLRPTTSPPTQNLAFYLWERLTAQSTMGGVEEARDRVGSRMKTDRSGWGFEPRNPGYDPGALSTRLSLPRTPGASSDPVIYLSTDLDHKVGGAN